MTAFDIERAMPLVREAVEPYPPAALFQLADEGFDAPFEQLVACVISVRTRDEVTLTTARRVFERVRTPEELCALSVAEIDTLIATSSFHEAKAENLHTLACQVVEEHDHQLPCDDEKLQAFHGIGPKCAHLVLAIGCGEPHISVDVHVHRITNRWGYVDTNAPEQTMRALQKVLPEKYWVEINRLLVPFGKHICTGYRPHCSECPLQEMCPQVGVENPR